MPLPHTNFKIIEGFDKPTYTGDDGKKKETTKNGIADHYNFVAHPNNFVAHPKLPLGTVAARRIPCFCEPCHAQSIIPWDNNKPFHEQEPWKTPRDCVLCWEVGDLNAWKFLTIKPKPGDYEEAEIHDCFSDALQIIEEEVGKEIKPNHYGAVNAEDPQGAPDGYYLVQWAGEPFILQEPALVEGCDGGPMPEGTIVVKGRYLHRVPRNPHWYQFKEFHGKVDLFRVQYILDPDIPLVKFNKKDGNTPTRGSMTKEEERMAPSRCYKVPAASAAKIEFEKNKRKVFDYVEMEWPDEAGAADAVEEDDEEEDLFVDMDKEEVE